MPLLALKPVLAIADTKSAIDSFLEALLALASMKPILSFATSTSSAPSELRLVLPPLLSTYH